jgi:hypothetical protein
MRQARFKAFDGPARRVLCFGAIGHLCVQRVGNNGFATCTGKPGEVEETKNDQGKGGKFIWSGKIAFATRNWTLTITTCCALIAQQCVIIGISLKP